MRSKTQLFEKYVALRQEEHTIAAARDVIRYDVSRYLDRTERHLLYLQCEQWEQERTMDEFTPEQRAALKRASISNIRMEVTDCPVCSAPNAVGAAHCVVCDTALGVEYDAGVRTSMLRECMGTHYEFNSQLVLKATESRESLRLQPQITPRGLKVGRDSQTIRPDVDLDPVGASTKGVSRQHAIIRFDRTQQCLTIEDTGSTNGTFINDVRVPANKEVIISDGDVITLGRLSFHAHIRSGEMIRQRRASHV